MKFVCFAAFALSILPSNAQESGTEANKKLRASIQKWTAVMKEIQESKSSWRGEKQVMLDSKEALAAEKAQLAEELKAAEARKTKLDSKSKEKIEQRDSYNKAREVFRAGLDKLESKVSAVIPLLPKELAEEDKVAKAISDHKSHVSKAGKEKEDISLNTRLGSMVTILAEAEKFNQVVTSFANRTVELDGEKLVLEGIYFGLAMGFAANKEGTAAIQLKPGPDGWVEERISDDETIRQVRELIDVGTGAGEIRLVPLNLEIAK